MLEEFSYLGEQTAYDVVVKNTRLVADWVDNIKPIPMVTFPPFIEGAEEDKKTCLLKKAAELMESAARAGAEKNGQGAEFHYQKWLFGDVYYRPEAREKSPCQTGIW